MSVSSGEVRAAAALIRLATGSSDGNWPSVPWPDVAMLATRERCIALTWLRSKKIIASHAEPEVTRWWRNGALRSLGRGYAHVETLATLTGALGDDGIRCVILKGAPLSVALYGEPGARSSADLDVWIPLRDRPRARQVMLELGWTHADGSLPHDEAFRQPSMHGENYLEVHSHLLHWRLDYLAMPDPEYSAVKVTGSTLQVMGGALLPGYLAVQIAKHRFAPLLWLIDLRTLWDQLDAEARVRALWTARRCGIHRYLQSALRLISLLDRDADPLAIRRLGLRRQRRDAHPMWRHILLAPSATSALRAARSWLAPPWSTGRGLGAIEGMRRVHKYWRAALGTSGNRGPNGRPHGVAAREVTVRGEELLRVARAVCLLGGRMWISATGTSMFPTLRDGDRVLLEPVSQADVGDIVLVDSGGLPILHRIVDVVGDQITTRGDARMTVDGTTRPCDVIARATRVRRGNLDWSLKAGTWRRLRLRAAYGRQGGAPVGGSRAGA